MAQHRVEQGGATGAMAGDAAQHWQQEGIVAAFVEQAGAHAEERRALFNFACDLFPFEPDDRIRVLDLCAGYGAFAAAVLDRFPNATAVGLDVSEPMMAVGRERMARFGDRFVYYAGDLSAGELPAGLAGPFDAVIASAFVSHFLRETKQRLCGEVFRVLNPGSCFFNVDMIAPASAALEAWYRDQLHLGNASRLHGVMHRDHFEPEAHMIHHQLERELDQLVFLRVTGFVLVDCFYKRLLQAVIGGYKPSREKMRR
jgi:ubiquinone/menaquinone biosynthesis C-methylase UbiE